MLARGRTSLLDKMSAAAWRRSLEQEQKRREAPRRGVDFATSMAGRRSGRVCGHELRPGSHALFSGSVEPRAPPRWPSSARCWTSGAGDFGSSRSMERLQVSRACRCPPSRHHSCPAWRSAGAFVDNSGDGASPSAPRRRCSDTASASCGCLKFFRLPPR